MFTGGINNHIFAKGSKFINAAYGRQFRGNLQINCFNNGTAAASNTFWSGSGVWSTPTGAGDVTGPFSATDTDVCLFNGTSGKVIKGSGVTVSALGNITANGIAHLNNKLSLSEGGTGNSLTSVQGDMYYSNGGGMTQLAKNTSSTRYLANTGSNNNPNWDQVNLTNGVTGVLPTANGGSNWVYITSATASSSSTIDFTGLSSTYFAYVVVCSHIVPTTNATDLLLRTSVDNGSTFSSTAGDYISIRLSATSGGIGAAAGATTSILIRDVISNTASRGYSGLIWIFNESASKNCYIKSMGGGLIDSGGALWSNNESSGERLSAAAVNAVRLLMSSGTISTGNFKLYGVTAA